MTSLVFLERYPPWKTILSTLTLIYGARNLDNILGLSGELRYGIPVAFLDAPSL